MLEPSVGTMRPKIEIRLRTDLRLVSGDGSPYLHRCHQKPKGVAKVAAARKLAVRLYWMLRSAVESTGTSSPSTVRQFGNQPARRTTWSPETWNRRIALPLQRARCASAKRRRFRLS